MSDSIVIDTPDGIAFFRLAALKGALSMQVAGLKLSRNRSATGIAKQSYGLKGQAKTMLPIVEQQVEDLTKLKAIHPEDLAGLKYILQLCLNASEDEGTSVEEELKRYSNTVDTEVTELFRAILRVYRFEERSAPGARCLFRDMGQPLPPPLTT